MRVAARDILQASGNYGGGRGGRPGAEPKVGTIAPHPVQDHGQLSGYGNARPRHAAMLGDLHAPGPQAGPFLAAHEQRVGGLV